MKISDIVQDWNSLPWACSFGPNDPYRPDISNAKIEDIIIREDGLSIKINDGNNTYMVPFKIEDESLKQKFIKDAIGMTLKEAENISYDEE